MVTQKLLITDPLGLHARTAKVLVDAMTDYSCDVYIIHKDERINAKSIINLMTSCIKCGAEIEVECDGSDEAAALEKACELIQSGLEA